MRKQFFKIIISTLAIHSIFMIFPPMTSAQVCNETTVNQCIDGNKCIAQEILGSIQYIKGPKCGGSAIVGEVQPPGGIRTLNAAGNPSDPSGYNSIGLIFFLSQLLRLATIVAGIWVMFNFIFAGLIYVSSNGDAAAHGKVSEKITYSVIGILIIVVAYTLAAIVSLLFFGDASYILSPTLVTIQDVQTPTP